MGVDPRDPRPMLALFALLVIAVIVHAASSIHPAHLVASAASLAPLALGAIAIASALAPQRFRATRRTLATRTAVAVVPADEFDPKAEAVQRFAAELARSDRSLRGWFDRRARALRVRLTNDRKGRLVYLLEVPARSHELLRTALRDYEGVELREVAEVLPAQPEQPVRLRTELVLARPSIEPLAQLALDPDPLQPFAAAMASLRAEHGEQVSVCVDLLPTAGLHRARLRARLKRQAKRLHGEKRSLTEILNNERPRRGKSDPTALLERRMVGQALDAKLRGSEPLYEAQVLLCAEAAEKPRAKLAMQLLLAAFEPLRSHNWLRPSGIGAGEVVFFGSDFPTRRRGFDRRLATGLHRPAERSVLTAREVAGFLKPPSAHCVSTNVVRSGTLLPAAPSLPIFEEGRADLIPLGKVSGEHGKRIVGARTADTFFTYIAGRSRYGKTETAIAQFVHLVRSGSGGLFLDPHGDALERIKPYLAEPAVASRVVEIDVSESGAWELPGWNLFELGGERCRGSRVAGGGDRRRLRLDPAVGRSVDAGDQPDHAGDAGAGPRCPRPAARALPDDLSAAAAALQRALARGGAALPALPQPRRSGPSASRASPRRRSRRSPTWSTASRAQPRSRHCSARAKAPTGRARRWTRA